VRNYVQYLGLFNAITSVKEAVNVTSISGLTRIYRIAAERLHSSARLCLAPQVTLVIPLEVTVFRKPGPYDGEIGRHLHHTWHAFDIESSARYAISY
jgi:hypothetical protein